MGTNRKSKWYKMVGGDFGCIKLQGKWIWYDCLICARTMFPDHFMTPRWQGPPSPAIEKTIKERPTRIYCGGSDMHNLVFKNKV